MNKLSEKHNENNDHRRKKRGCFIPLLILIALIIAVFFAFAWLNDPSRLIANRDIDSTGDINAGEDMLFILLVGSDKNESVSDTSRADTIIVAAVDFNLNELFFLSIPRDSYMPIPGYGPDKINHAYAYGGIELLSQSLRDYLAIPIDYYALIDFGGFETLVDALGGVEIEVDKRMYYQTYDALIDIEAGWQRLDGEQALQYVRYRCDALGDITRVSRQQLLLKAIFREFTADNVYLKLPQLLSALNLALETDLSYPDMLSLMLFSKDIDPDLVESATLSGDFMTLDGISYWQVEEEAMRELVSSRFKGGS